MESFAESMIEYKKQLAAGILPHAYKGLVEYIMRLRTYFDDAHPNFFVSSSIYFGYMDMSFFAIVPESLKQRKLKVVIVFVHATCRFEVWLAGVNKQIQTKYWNIFNQSGWNKYHIVPTTKGEDSILEHELVENPDFSDLTKLTKHIEWETLIFIKEVEDFLSKQAV